VSYLLSLAEIRQLERNNWHSHITCVASALCARKKWKEGRLAKGGNRWGRVEGRLEKETTRGKRY